jgi:hypothetical protein
MPTRSGASYRIIMSSSPQVNQSYGTPHSPPAQDDPGLGEAGDPAVPDHTAGEANVANGHHLLVSLLGYTVLGLLLLLVA